MKQPNVISYDCLPVSLPLSQALILWLLIDRFQPAEWVVGMAWTLFSIYLVACVWALWMQNPKPVEGFGRVK